MPRLPRVSGDEVARLLRSLGYEFVRQRGSHARYALTRPPRWGRTISPFPCTASLPKAR
jgi:predicted RNA binding protein YcfA (HicA-like mRNA interferase family)